MFCTQLWQLLKNAHPTCIGFSVAVRNLTAGVASSNSEHVYPLTHEVLLSLLQPATCLPCEPLLIAHRIHAKLQSCCARSFKTILICLHGPGYKVQCSTDVLYCPQIHPPSAVSHCCQAYLTHAASRTGHASPPNLVLVRATLLQIYSARLERVQPTYPICLTVNSQTYEVQGASRVRQSSVVTLSNPRP